MGKKMKKKSLELLQEIRTKAFILYSLHETDYSYVTYTDIVELIDKIIAQEKEMKNGKRRISN
jgi:hypothetical protein